MRTVRTRPLLAIAALASIGLLAANCTSDSADADTSPPREVRLEPEPTTSLPQQQRYDDQTGLLYGPHFSLKIARTATLDADTPAPVHDKTTDVRASDGHELIVSRFGETQRRPPWSDAMEQVTASVIVGDRTTKLDRLPSASTQLVVSTPEGTDPLLRVTDRGRAQTLNLRTGERVDDTKNGQSGADQAAAYYREAPTTKDLPDYHASGVAEIPGYGAMEGTYDTEIGKARLEPYVPSQGWAPKGQTWLLLLDVNFSGTTPDKKHFSPAHLDTQQAFQLQLPDGTMRRPATSELLDGRIVTGQRQTVPFAVPADFDRATLRVQVDGPFAAGTDDPDGRWIKQPKAKQIPIAMD